MKIRYAQIESIKQNLILSSDPSIRTGMIEVTALGITEDNTIVRFYVLANDSLTTPPLHEFLDTYSALLKGTDQGQILEVFNSDGRLVKE